MTARCGRCHETLPLTAEHWYRNKARPNGFDGWCKRCRKAFIRTPEHRAVQQAYQQRERQRMYRKGGHYIRVDAAVHAGLNRRKAALTERYGRPISLSNVIAALLRQTEDRS